MTAIATLQQQLEAKARVLAQKEWDLVVKAIPLPDLEETLMKVILPDGEEVEVQPYYAIQALGLVCVELLYQRHLDLLTKRAMEKLA